MFRLLSLIAFLGLPFGEEFANIMIKIFNWFGFYEGFLAGDKYEEVSNKLDKKLNGKLTNKLIDIFWKLVLLGPIYVSWIVVKWTCKLTWRLIRLIFVRKRA